MNISLILKTFNGTRIEVSFRRDLNPFHSREWTHQMIIMRFRLINSLNETFQQEIHLSEPMQQDHLLLEHYAKQFLQGLNDKKLELI